MSVLVGKQAPDFNAVAVMPDDTFNDKFKFSDYIKGKIAVLFFWPADFTFVCPTEVIAFNNKLKEFNERGVVIVGCSKDSQFVHFNWKKTPPGNGGVGEIQFPMVADTNGSILEAYDVVSANNFANRATFLIDQNGIVRHQIVNDPAIGRNIDELLRTIDALIFYQQHGEVCPANWKKGQEGIKETASSVADYLKKNADKL